MFLPRTLDLNEMTASGHDYVHVYFCLNVLAVIQVQYRLSIYNAHADGCHTVLYGKGRQKPLLLHVTKCVYQGHKPPRDGNGTRAAIRLEDIAIYPYSPLP